jgi:hypothetical protein
LYSHPPKRQESLPEKPCGFNQAKKSRQQQMQTRQFFSQLSGMQPCSTNYVAFTAVVDSPFNPESRPAPNNGSSPGQNQAATKKPTCVGFSDRCLEITYGSKRNQPK